MTTPRWTAAIFDLDGTLVNTIELAVATTPLLTAPYVGAAVAAGRSLVGDFGDDPNTHRALAEHISSSGDDVQTVQRSYPGMAELLGDLLASGVKVAVATSKGRELAIRAVAAAGLSDLVELTTTADETTLQKPHPEPILHARRHLNAEDEACVYIGDGTWDVRAGAAAGLDQIAVGWGACTPEDLASQEPTAGVVTSVAELRTVLLG